MKATLRLFKGLPIKERVLIEVPDDLHKKTIKKGFVFAPEVVYNYRNYDELIKMTEEVIGISGENANKTFHKSWRKIKESDIEQLVVEQIAHYLTTYGKDNPGLYMLQKETENWGVENLTEKVVELEDLEKDKIGTDYIYIPKEKLIIPKLKEGIMLTLVRGYTKEELKTKLLKLLESGIALKEETLKDVIDVALFVGIESKDIDNIKNKEAKTALYEYLNLAPENPIEFLRMAIYTATGETLLIKSKELIEKIKANKNLKVVKLFETYPKEKLAKIFFRFKPLFLAFRMNRKMKTIINKIRKLADEYHEPMKEDYLNMVTAKIKNNIPFNRKELESYLERANIFRKIRLAYALKYRTKKGIDSILYRIRNGKAYADDFDIVNERYRYNAFEILDIVIDFIVEDMNVKNKKIYIPEYIHYTLPATEKQFTGDFPSGTYVSISSDMVFGIHWKNKEGKVDLDLSLISQSKKYGWDGNYRSDGSGVMFSGDITNAPKGATELYYVKRSLDTNLIVYVNYYDYRPIEVPYQIIVGKERSINRGENRMLDPNNIFAITDSIIKTKQKIIGLLVSEGNDTRFYFAETSIGNTITSGLTEVAERSRKYLFNYYVNSIKLKDILVKAGAEFVKKEDCEIDLSPENINRNIFIDLLKEV